MTDLTEADRRALIHMLVAQREQINASLALLLKEEPEQPAEETKRQRPRVFGEQRMVGGSAVQPPKDGG